MKNLDARKLTPEIQQHNRDLAIRWFQQGKKRADIAEIAGIHYSVACRWIRAWERGGEKAIKQGQRGRRAEQQRCLRAAQESILKKLLTRPIKRRFSVKLRKEGMTRAQIGEVVGVHPDTVGRWLKACAAQGAKALKSQVRGPREGDCRGDSTRNKKASFKSFSLTRRLSN